MSACSQTYNINDNHIFVFLFLFSKLNYINIFVSTAAEVHKHTNSLRTQYTKAARLSADMKSGSGANDVKLSKRDKYLVQALTFLAPFARTRRTESSMTANENDQV